MAETLRPTMPVPGVDDPIVAADIVAESSSMAIGSLHQEIGAAPSMANPTVDQPSNAASSST